MRLLGVDPAHQGQGLGSTLTDHGHRRADETGHSCYLETFAEHNVPLYLRHGFELVVDETEPSSGIRTWGFYRAQERTLACASVSEGAHGGPCTMALVLGKRLIHGDSTGVSRPILERAGLAKVSTTTPRLWSPAGRRVGRRACCVACASVRE